MKNSIEQFLSRLSERERLMLLLYGPVFVVVLFYFLFWLPFENKIELLQERVAEQQSTARWMQASAQQVKNLQQLSGANDRGARESLLALVDKTMRQSGLSKALKRVEPDGDSKVKVRLEQANFDVATKWLETLRNRYAVTVQNISIDRQDSVGIVNIRLTLVGTGE